MLAFYVVGLADIFDARWVLSLSPRLGYASWRSYDCIAVPRHSGRSVYASRGGRSITIPQLYVRTRFYVTADAVYWNGIGLPMTHIMGYGY